jgi:hypothetical protein
VPQKTKKEEGMGVMHLKQSVRSVRLVRLVRLVHSRLTVVLPHKRLEQTNEHVLLDLAFELGIRRERAERVVLDCDTSVSTQSQPSPYRLATTLWTTGVDGRTTERDKLDG